MRKILTSGLKNKGVEVEITVLLSHKENFLVDLFGERWIKLHQASLGHHDKQKG